jgi:hypothetical protein
LGIEKQLRLFHHANLPLHRARLELHPRPVLGGAAAKT